MLALYTSSAGPPGILVPRCEFRLLEDAEKAFMYSLGLERGVNPDGIGLRFLKMGWMTGTQFPIWGPTLYYVAIRTKIRASFHTNSQISQRLTLIGIQARLELGKKTILTSIS